MTEVAAPAPNAVEAPREPARSANLEGTNTNTATAEFGHTSEPQTPGSGSSTFEREAAAVIQAAPTRPSRPRRESAPARSDSTTAAKAAAPTYATPPHAVTNSARCSDILQKASLEPLTASEAAYLKRECR